MIQNIFNFFAGLGNEFALFMISLIPLIEERGAIIFGAAKGMPWYKVLPICVVSNLLPVPFLLLFGMKIIKWLKTTKTFGSFFTRYEEKLNAKSETIVFYHLCCLVYGICIVTAACSCKHLVIQRLHTKLDDVYTVFFQVVQDFPVNIVRAGGQVNLMDTSCILIFFCSSIKCTITI